MSRKKLGGSFALQETFEYFDAKHLLPLLTLNKRFYNQTAPNMIPISLAPFPATALCIITTVKKSL
jgi:hypothetical protein